MAFNNSITARYDELRSPNPPSSSATTGTTTPSRYSGSFMQSHSQSFGDTRASVQRRQTTDLSKMPAITPIGQQPTPTTQGESVDIAATVRQQPLHFPQSQYRLSLGVIVLISKVAVVRYTLGGHHALQSEFTDICFTTDFPQSPACKIPTLTSHIAP